MWEYYLWKSKASTIDSLRKKRINIIIGDSRGMSGIMPILLPNDFINLSLSGSTVFEGFHTLKKLLNNGNKVDTLIICYAQFHFEENTELTRRTIPFSFINFSDLLELERMEMKTGYRIDGIEDRKIFAKDMIFRNASLMRLPISYRSMFVYNHKNNNYSRGIDEMLASINSQRGYSTFGKADSARQEAKDANRKHFHANPVLKLYLESILNLAKTNNIKVYITVPPISELTYNKCSPTYISSFNGFLHSIQKSNQCTILNHTVVFPNIYFGDASHLNRKGAIKYTNELNKNISSKSSLTTPHTN